MEQATIFFLIRHGEAVQNVRRILDSAPGNPEFGLTGNGREQIARAAAAVSSECVDRIFSSPLRRTRETTELLSEACPVPVSFDDRIRETDFGVWNGRQADDFWERYPDPSMRIDGNPEERLEGFRDMRLRLAAFLSDVLSDHAGQRIGIVSHGDPLEQLHGLLRGWPIERAVSDWYPEKGTATRVEVSADILERLISGNPEYS